MTPLEALEAYSSSHPETIRELLEWPRRRFIRAFEVWSRREMVAEWNQRKLDHIAALRAQPMKTDEMQAALQSVEEMYEDIKRELMIPAAERQEMEDKIMSAPFMQASRRNIAKYGEQGELKVPINYNAPRVSDPGEESFRHLPIGID